MDDEVEDIVGDVKYTDSQKSVTMSAVYSLDFTDSSSDKNNSSGKDTYVIEYDSDDSDKTFQVHKSESIINLIDKGAFTMKQGTKEVSNPIHSVDRAVCTSVPICNIIAQEIFTQTSKTIIELAKNEISKSSANKTLETQTSFVSITENKSVEYKIHILGKNYNYNANEIKDTPFNCENMFKQNIPKATNNLILSSNNCEGKISIFREPETEGNTDTKTLDNSDEDVIHFIEDESRDYTKNKVLDIHHNDKSECESTNYDSDMESDSLMENEYCENKIKSRDETSETSEMLNLIDSDVEELYNRLSESPQLLSPILSAEPAIRNFGILTPLTEETALKKESIVDLTPSVQTLTKASEFTSKNTFIVNNSGVRLTVLSDSDYTEEYGNLKLPPIHKNQSLPSSRHLNFLFTLNNQNPLRSTCILPSLNERQNDKYFNRWEIGTRELASGESPHISGRSDSVNTSNFPIHLPSIYSEGVTNNNNNGTNYLKNFTPSLKQSSANDSCDTISIQGKIKELKMSARRTRPKFSSRSGSPTSLSSPNETRTCDAAEKGCDLLCAELLRKLRSSSWVEITETLEDIPKALEKFWCINTENRIADLLRQVTGHVDSPRTQVARAACKTLAEILKNTNYTKKPEFYECISTLLSKTGSYNRPVRREANVALDDIVCSVDVTHCVTAICVYGVSHKSVLVRGASARLLVVCCALAEGGRQILRTRPPSAAAARRHALRSLAELLQDKNTDTRKYAERLYAILRPLPNFEAFFLTDVDVELAAKHMKKYDQLFNNTKSR